MNTDPLDEWSNDVSWARERPDLLRDALWPDGASGLVAEVARARVALIREATPDWCSGRLLKLRALDRPDARFGSGAASLALSELVEEGVLEEDTDSLLVRWAA